MPVEFRPAQAASHPWWLNTSNPAKLADYRRLLARHGLVLGGHTGIDLREIEASPLTVLVHKASHFAADWVLVDDGCLEVEGCDIGVNVRWLIAALPSLAGRTARMRVTLGFREGGRVVVSEGLVEGRVVAARGEAPRGFPVLPFFCPDGRRQTLAEHRDDDVNPRAQAVAALARGDFVAILPPIDAWDGPWQEASSAPPAPRG